MQGRTRYEEIDLFRQDRLFRDSFGLAYVPARETVRLYLERMAEESEGVQEEVDRATIRLLRRASLTPIRTELQSYLLVDVDTSPFLKRAPPKISDARGLVCPIRQIEDILAREIVIGPNL